MDAETPKCASCGRSDVTFDYSWQDATVCVNCTAELDDAPAPPDKDCVTTPDGGCVSKKACMHDPFAARSTPERP